MIRGRSTHWALVRALMVAFAIAGAGLDLIPTPLLASSGWAEFAVEPDEADAENERDARPDDATDLDWALVQLSAAGVNRRNSARGVSDLLLASPRLRSGRAAPRWIDAPARPVSLPVQFCRLLC